MTTYFFHSWGAQSPKPTQKPHPQPLPKPRQLAATDLDPTEMVPSSGEWVHRGQADAIYYHTCDTINNLFPAILIYIMYWFMRLVQLTPVASLYSMYFVFAHSWQSQGTSQTSSDIICITTDASTADNYRSLRRGSFLRWEFHGEHLQQDNTLCYPLSSFHCLLLCWFIELTELFYTLYYD